MTNEDLWLSVFSTILKKDPEATVEAVIRLTDLAYKALKETTKEDA